MFTGITLVSDGWSGTFLILLLSDVIHVLRLCELSPSGLLEFICVESLKFFILPHDRIQFFAAFAAFSVFPPHLLSSLTHPQLPSLFSLTPSVECFAGVPELTGMLTPELLDVHSHQSYWWYDSR